MGAQVAKAGRPANFVQVHPEVVRTRSGYAPLGETSLGSRRLAPLRNLTMDDSQKERRREFNGNLTMDDSQEERRREFNGLHSILSGVACFALGLFLASSLGLAFLAACGGAEQGAACCAPLAASSASGSWRGSGQRLRKGAREAEAPLGPGSGKAAAPVSTPAAAAAPAEPPPPPPAPLLMMASPVKPAKDWQHPSLFCFCVMQAGNYELSLVRLQLERRTSIFNCEEWTVFSDTNIALGRGPDWTVNTTLLGRSLTANTGVVEHILNSMIFAQAWENVQTSGQYLAHDWVTKVDPDAVFIPERLRMHLRRLGPIPGKGVYLINCKHSFGFYGALEVVSKHAVYTYSMGMPRCKEKFPFRDWGEDLFMRKCLDTLGVQRQVNFDVLRDVYCGAKTGRCGSGAAAFHPYKAPENYARCLAQAEEDLATSPGLAVA